MTRRLRRGSEACRPAGIGRAGRAALLPGAALLALLAGPGPAAAQSPSARSDPPIAPWRFPAGERATYAVTFGPVRVGEGRLGVEAVDSVGGTPAYRLVFELQGGPFFYKMDDRQVSWVEPDPLRSLVFEQRLRQGDYKRDRRYVMDHAAGTYTRWDMDRETGEYRRHEEHTDEPMPAGALDEIAYLYLARLLPLRPGDTYRFDRYFEEDGNPVVIEVLRRERIRVPAGSFEAIVVRPTIKTSGMFGEGGKAEVFISDDDRRVIVRLKARMKVGEMEMFLIGYEPGEAGALIAPAPATPAPSG